MSIGEYNTVYNPKIVDYYYAYDQNDSASPGSSPPDEYKGVRIAMVQTNNVVPNDNATNAIIQQVVETNTARLSLATSLAKNKDAHMIVVPDLFLTGYDYGHHANPGKAIPLMTSVADYLLAQNYMSPTGPIAALASIHNIAIICSMPDSRNGPSGASGLFDVAFVFHPNGGIEMQYKTHLNSYERQIFDYPYYPATTTPVTQGFSQVHDQDSPYAPFVINGFPVGVTFDYAAQFPEVTRALALNGSLLTVVLGSQAQSTLNGYELYQFPNMATHDIPGASLQNLNFTAYANRTGSEWMVGTGGNPVNQRQSYPGNSIVCQPYGGTIAKPMTNQDTLIIADCVYCDYPQTQPANVEYLINRRPELCGYITNQRANFPAGLTYTYPDNPAQHTDPNAAATTDSTDCGW